MQTSTDPPLVAVDIGNHQIKLGLIPCDPSVGLPEPQQVFKLATATDALDDLTAWLPATPVRWCVATVHREAERRLADWVRQQRAADRYVLVRHAVLPLAIRVEHPERVGTDRLLAALAVNALRGKPAGHRGRCRHGDHGGPGGLGWRSSKAASFCRASA